MTSLPGSARLAPCRWKVVWAARGWWAGLAAIGLAVLGQDALIARGDASTAGALYLVAGALLIAGLVRPTRPGDDCATAKLAGAPALSAGGRERTVPSWWRCRIAHVGGTGRWHVRAGLGLTVGLALMVGVAAAVLRADIANPVGGWLWALALLTLLSSVSLPIGRRPADDAPAPARLPGPQDDVVGPGVPELPRRWQALLIGAILLVALAMRLVDLEYLPGIFGDEGERGMDARAIVEGRPTLLFGSGWWSVPNLYFACVAWMLRLFGDSMVGLRMLSVISGVAAVAFVYGIGRLGWGPRVGLIAAALLAVSPLALQFSRLAGESTPTAALWAGGFFFLFRALRGRRSSDWVLAGMLWGFSLYFYASGKLIIGLLPAIGLYGLLRWRRAFIDAHGRGFLLLNLAFGLTFMPYAIFSIGDNWQSFAGRAQETSIFAPRNQALAFARYGIPYDPAQATQPLVHNVLTHPLAWGQLIFEQLRVTTEVLYRRGDPTAFYQIREHGGSMLSPLLAALALLGLAYAGAQLADPRYGLLSLWFWGGMLGAALTIDTPSVQRLAGAWPAVMLFPAVVLDRVWAAAWPFSPALARRWATVPLAALLVYVGIAGYREYFVHYAALCPYCDATTQARYVQALGQEYRAYQLGVGEPGFFFGYGSTRFIAGGVEGADLAVPADSFPITDNNAKGAAFLVYPHNAHYLPLIRLFYPGGLEEPITSADGVNRFTSYKLTAEQLAGFQALTATYATPGGQVVTRDEPNLGTARSPDQSDRPWMAPDGLDYPATVTWEGGLVAPAHGQYTLTLAGSGDSVLEVDGVSVLDERADGTRPTPGRVELMLTKGIHDVRLSGTLAHASGRVALAWSREGKAPEPVPARYLSRGPTGGLRGEVWPATGAVTLEAPGLADARAPAARRGDPFLGFREATVALGRAPFVARWLGTLEAPVAGRYAFETSSNGPSLLLIDGRTVVDNRASRGLATGAGSIQLTPGPHAVELRYGWREGPARLEWYWTPPSGTRDLVPPTVLRPEARSWPPGAVPTLAGGARWAPPAAAGEAPLVATVGLGVGLKEPRGLAVDGAGNQYVADSGHQRVVVLDAGGRPVRTWGLEGKDDGQLARAEDVAVGPDGHVYVLDLGVPRVEVFTPDGLLVRRIDGIGVWCSPAGFTVAPDGGLYLADTCHSRVLRYTPAGDLQGELRGGADPSTRLDQPVDVAVGESGAVYAADLRQRVVELDPSTGLIRQTWEVPVGTSRGAANLAVGDGILYLTDPDRHTITAIDTRSGQISAFGQRGNQAGQLSVPVGVAAGPDGRVYVVDSDNARVQLLTSPLSGPGREGLQHRTPSDQLQDGTPSR